MNDELTSVFREEIRDLVDSLERGLLDLKARPQDADLVNQVFRDLHTIKGSGAMFGFVTLSGFIHDFETAFDRVRSGKAQVTPDLIRLGLAARDQIPALLDDVPDPQDLRGDILRTLQALTCDGPGDPQTSAQSMLSFRLTGPALALGTRPELILQELVTLGATEINANTDDLPDLNDLDPGTCAIFWQMLVPASVKKSDIEDVFLFVDAEWTLKALSNEISDQDLPAIDPDETAADPDDAAPKMSPAKEAEATLRVPAKRLDTLMDSVGELVTVEARLAELALQSNDPALIATSELITRLAGQLRDATIVMRMVPLRSLVARFRRLIHTLSETLGKSVEFVINGEETELDKTMIEKLADPLVHILRNALDHGMETATERQTAGKTGNGRIELSAIHAGGEVLIRVRDDGKGMNPEYIRTKAVKRGLITPDAQLTEKQIFALVFEPGFSTAETVTEVSGRGVGMDVVRRTIINLRGSIDVESCLGQGTTVTLRLPLTLAIIDGMLIDVAGEKYTLPLATVKEIVELPIDKVAASKTEDFLDIRGKFVPFVRLRAAFDCDGPLPKTQNVVIVETTEGSVGFVVDHIIGTNQTVIKQMSKLHSGVRSISGATILGDGTVALIIDVPQLLATTCPQGDLGKEIAA